MRFHDRAEAGRRLAARLAEYEDRFDVVVLALTGGGISVAAEVAARLDAPLDVLVVRTLRAPSDEALAIGAIAARDVEVLDTARIRDARIPLPLIAWLAGHERAELDRAERRFRPGRPPLDVRDRSVILVDDGAASGMRMAAAVLALRELAPARIIVALPVCAERARDRLRPLAERLVCLDVPLEARPPADLYDEPAPAGDEEAATLLDHIATGRGATSPRSAPAASGDPHAGHHPDRLSH